ncbi:MAG: glucose-6-phosphate dehydrogenase [Parvularcula sp.]
MTQKMDDISAQFVPVSPFDLVVFGATGDLSLRKLLPSLYHRWLDGQIPPSSQIIGVSRSAMSSEEFRALALDSYQKFHPDEVIDQKEWSEFTDHIEYVAIDALAEDADWSGIKALLRDAEKPRVFYLALPPALFGPVAEAVAREGLKSPGSRIVLEKPIGTDVESARAVNDAVGRVFSESETFRIDHYLGKETVQNLLVLRFMNSIFEPVWNANAIDHVQVSVAETVGAGNRASYYDTAGALRDMVQNHLLQLLCLVAMEPPYDLDPDTVRDEKIKVLRALRPISADTVRAETVRGQYIAGASQGQPVSGYEDELGHPSDTETFVAISAHIDNWRWKGVPFYLRTGKRMQERRSEIIIQFKDVAHSLMGGGRDKVPPTRLVIRLQPDEGMRLLLVTKDPGPGGMRLRYVPLNLSYAEAFSARYPDAYERLLMAVVRGDLGLFMRRDEVENAWAWVDAIQGAWQEDKTPVYDYPAGTDGPVQSAMLLDRNGHEWYDSEAT